MKRPPLLLAALVAASLAAAAPAQQRNQPGNPFQLDAAQQAYLDQVLKAWETESAKVRTFNCPFTRWDYNAFAPAPNIAYSEEEGQVSYQQPDKGSFKINEIKVWTPKPVAPGQPVQGTPQGEYVKQSDAIGEHWVCDGKSVYQFKHEQKQLHVQAIPPHLRGKAIVDGPLPFLFGAKAEKLKERYWMFIKPTSSPDIIQLVAAPRRRAAAAEYKGIELQLDKNRMLPVAMKVWRPDNSHTSYQFHIAQASVNARLGRLWAALFQAPRTPRGWTRVDEPVPQARQAIAPGQQQR